MAEPIEHSFAAMGASFHYKAYPQEHLSHQQIMDLFKKAHHEVLRIENKFTDFRPSPFQRINELAGISPCQVDDEILHLILKAIEFSRLSEGRFDISFASVGHRWRTYKKKGIPFPEKERKELEEFINFKKIEIDEQKKTIFLPFTKMQIGMGGIGKGYAVDQAFKILADHRLENFYINGSGDIRVHSSVNAPRKWKIGIRNPFNLDPSIHAGLIQVSNQSVSTSGSYVQFNPAQHSDHHIIRKDKNDANIVSATVIHETCMFTDTMGTILMAMKTSEARRFLDNLDISAILIDQTGKTHLSALALKQFGK